MNDMHNHTGCCNSGGGCGGCCCKHDITLSDKEKEFLLLLAQTPFLPVTSFILKSTKSEHLEAVALAPVYLADGKDTIETVKDTGKVIERLAELHIISLDYDIPLENCDYSEYETSDLFEFFKETVAGGTANADYIFDIPFLQLGSMALTSIGQDVLDSFSQP